MATYTRVGTETNGDGAWLRDDVAPAWAAFVKLAIARLNIDFSKRVVQAKGGSTLSAGTHADGCAVDLRTRGLTRSQINAAVALLRECGFAATWFRDWEGNQHIHAGANTARASRVSYQVAAVKAGRDGLGFMGRKGRDTHPKPSQWRTVTDGAAWARAQLAPTKPAAPSKPASPAKPIPAIPRVYGQPKVVLTCDGKLGAYTIRRLQAELNVRTTGKLDHYTIRALRPWLGMPDREGPQQIDREIVTRIQSRVGVTRDGKLGPHTIAALQRWLNQNRK